ncbi:Uncharacterized protein OBRU01_21002 [Operophtera brumata]|uniref:D-2-hydroxyglutarate dehydrogenase, mitochondrial n=1 Tax=Operophtera brumata TaxID=104452 RepID=A0A0L7KTJ3_OPEBR|nr:Uncharacterized protein OBRU01_21002 [Operophtera brumata]
MLKSFTFLVKISKNNVWEQVRFASQALPQLSSEKYNTKRKDFSTVQSTDVNYFKSLLSEDRVLTEDSDVLPFNIDWIKNCRGQSKVVLKPKTTQEVSEILKYCNERRLAVCPQGGNTGLVGGSVPVFDEITLDNYVRDRNLIMPLDLGAKGTCHIGGNASTNAGGLRLLRYGNLHGSLLGIEAKDNTGYHLKHLFIGSEGTLGVVTKVAIHCPVLPKAVTLGFFGVKSFENILQLFKSAKSSLGEILSAFEMADFDSINSTVRNLKLPDESHDAEKLNRFLTREMESGLILDGTVTSEPSKMQGYVFKYDVSLPLQNYYELVPRLKERLGARALIVCGYGHVGESNTHSIAGAGLEQGYVFKYDVSLPLQSYYELVPQLKERLGARALIVCGYGHVGESNTHSIAGAGLEQGYVFKYDVSLPLQNYYELVPRLKERLGARALIVCGYGHVGESNTHSIAGAGLEQGYVFKYDVSLPLQSYYELVPQLKERLGARALIVCGYGYSIAGASLVQGYVFKYDVSLPLQSYYELVPQLKERLGARALIVCGYGYVEYTKEVCSLLEPYIFEEVNKLKGSISAEHGVGFRKPQFIHYSKGEAALQLMHGLKQLMDPRGILNPYKVLPEM